MATENILFDLAEEFICQTSRPVFLTGKAGTGKTTFLKHIKATTSKKTVVVAPTGVAAIHAGGTTIHSFFQLPFTPFIPEERPANILQDTGSPNSLSDKYSLLKNMRMESEKRSLLRELELLIIDEVSMVRCDMLDAMDVVLRHFRRKPFVPFGGVQVLFIGDLFQLPPVIPDDQWTILRKYYEGPFFFHAHVIEQSRPLYIELKKIYRQTDPGFISLLNNIRSGEATAADLMLLNTRYFPSFQPQQNDHYITLTTHNRRADAINADRLETLQTPLYQFEGEVEGDFPERNFPTDRLLKLREGAQVMFIKNDTEKIRRYYNGKLGIIRSIDEEGIIVLFPQEEKEITLSKETWTNIRYALNPHTHDVEEEILGTFTQYAIRLAWAITIHKSQGLTFERAIIDAGKAFAPGQVYVALSRCTSLEGLVLCSRVFRNNIMTDEDVIRFAGEESSAEELQPILVQERSEFLQRSLLEYFDWYKILDEIEYFHELLERRKFKEKKEATDLITKLVAAVKENHLIAQKFQEQLRKLLRDANASQDYSLVEGRVEASVNYFSSQLDTLFLEPLSTHQQTMRNLKKTKGYLKDLSRLVSFFEGYKTQLAGALEQVANYRTEET